MVKKMSKESKWLFLISFIIFASGLPCPAWAETLKAETIRATVENHIRQRMPWAPGTERITFLSHLSDAVFTQGPLSLEVANKQEEDFVGDADFTLRYLCQGVRLKEERVRVRLEVLIDVIISGRAVAKNQEITADDIQVLKKWVRRIPDNIISTPEQVVGKAPTINLRPNVEITRNVLKAPILVRKGKVVRILLENGFLCITTLGISEEDGAAEATIRVKNLVSRKTVYARVTNDSLVKVEF